MKNAGWNHPLLRILFLLPAAAAPVAFPLSQMGYASLHTLAEVLVLPAVLMLLVLWLGLKSVGADELRTFIARGALAGTAATLALEAVRYSGFRLGYMPGNLPQLMGVLLLDRFALGPSMVSDLAGFAYHFWVGASFGIIFVLLAAGRPRWWAVAYGVAIGIGFLVSPVVQALGVGLFGKDFGWRFAATVVLAHAFFGATLGMLLPAAVGRRPQGAVPACPLGQTRTA